MRAKVTIIGGLETHHSFQQHIQVLQTPHQGMNKPGWKENQATGSLDTQFDYFPVGVAVLPDGCHLYLLNRVTKNC